MPQRRSRAARGESPTAFHGRGIPPDGVAPRSQIPQLLPRRALRWPSAASTWRALGATWGFHHGLLDRVALVVACASLFLTTGLRADDWPEWRGEGRLGVWTESGDRRALPRRRAQGCVARADPRGIRRSGGRRRPRLRARLSGDARHSHHGRHRASRGAERADRSGALDP